MFDEEFMDKLGDPSQSKGTILERKYRAVDNNGVAKERI
jgi:hypothetical protein